MYSHTEVDLEFLKRRALRVPVNVKLSDSVKITSGVPQGSLLIISSLMFLAFINDMTAGINSHIKLFVGVLIYFQIILLHPPFLKV